jgi:nucleotide-binding universal stress UspA family protein
VFNKILHANDGSDHAFKALALALQITKQNAAELHIVSVEEIPYLPISIEEIREARAVAARRFHVAFMHANAMAAEAGVAFKTHLLVGHPVRTIVDLAGEMGVDLLVIGATGHSALYERMVGSRADRIIQLAACPVLVVK